MRNPSIRSLVRHREHPRIRTACTFFLSSKRIGPSHSEQWPGRLHKTDSQLPCPGRKHPDSAPSHERKDALAKDRARDGRKSSFHRSTLADRHLTEEKSLQFRARFEIRQRSARKARGIRGSQYAQSPPCPALPVLNSRPAVQSRWTVRTSRRCDRQKSIVHVWQGNARRHELP